jgi:hypothetical protein
VKSLDEMIEGMHEHARAMLIGDEKAQLLPFFHIQFKDRPDTVMATPWRDDYEKNLTIRSIRAALKQFRPSVVNYAMVSECWMLRQDRAPRKGDPMPSESERRIECVVVSAGDHKGAKMKMWEIIRDDKGRPTDLVADKEDYDQFEGRLADLLNDE